MEHVHTRSLQTIQLDNTELSSVWALTDLTVVGSGEAELCWDKNRHTDNVTPASVSSRTRTTDLPVTAADVQLY